MADVKLPAAISILMLSECSNATLHITLLDSLRPELSGKLDLNNGSSFSSSSADRLSRLLMVGLLDFINNFEEGMFDLYDTRFLPPQVI